MAFESNINTRCPFFTRWAPGGRVIATNRYFECGTVLFKAADIITCQGNKTVKVTPMGMFITYSWKPTVKLVEKNDGIYVVTIGPLYAGKELTIHP